MSLSGRFYATSPLGFESLLAQELVNMGASTVSEAKAGIVFEGDLALAYRACLWSRLANRILMPISSFSAVDGDALYRGVGTINWDAHLTPDSTIAVTFASIRSTITHTQFGAQKVKDAIVDQFRMKYGHRPSVDLVSPDIRINVYLNRDLATVSIDLSGDSLHKRGYRIEVGKAPLKENLAAAILTRAGWPEIYSKGGEFLDPMCGSGTLPIEAAMMAADIAPGLLRKHYGFLAWPQHDADLWMVLLNEADRRREAGLKRLQTPIRGFDIDPYAVKIAESNILRCGLDGYVQVEVRGAREVRPTLDSGLVCLNPPYGERLSDEESLIPVYTELGKTLRDFFSGWQMTLLTGNSELAFKLGIRASKNYTLFNGALECKLFNFSINADRFFTPHEGGATTELERKVNGLFRKAKSVDVSMGGAEMFANRLRKNKKNLAKWLRQSEPGCYRLYDADLPEYAVAIDVYEGEETWVHVQEYEAPITVDPDRAEGRLVEALAGIGDVLDIPSDHIALKIRRRQKGAAQYEKQSEKGQFHKVHETDLQFLVNFDDYLDTGLFLDHRPVRSFIRQSAKGKSFLNLFAYTGAATVYAAKGGASSTTTIDMSRTYLDWALKNLRLNNIDGDEHSLVQADCLEWLKEAVNSPWRYDLIFLDPPTFSTSKRMRNTLDVQRDHTGLIRLCMELLTNDGLLIFSTNNRRFQLDEQGLSEYSLKDFSKQTIPKDFERNNRIHYCWLISKA